MTTERKFHWSGLWLALALAVSAGAALLLLRSLAADSDGKSGPGWLDVALTAAICTAGGAWLGWRKNHAMALSGIRFVKRCRRRRWRELFGFAWAMAGAAAALGFILWGPRWMLEPAEQSLGETLAMVGATAAVGFLGGFLTQFTPPVYTPRV